MTTTNTRPAVRDLLESQADGDLAGFYDTIRSYTAGGGDPDNLILDLVAMVNATSNTTNVTRVDVAPDYNRLTVALTLQDSGNTQIVDLDGDNAIRLGLAVIDAAHKLHRFGDDDYESDNTEVHGTVLQLVPSEA